MNSSLSAIRAGVRGPTAFSLHTTFTLRGNSLLQLKELFVVRDRNQSARSAYRSQSIYHRRLQPRGHK
jgi:hypothetical protein